MLRPLARFVVLALVASGLVALFTAVGLVAHQQPAGAVAADQYPDTAGITQTGVKQWTDVDNIAAADTDYAGFNGTYKVWNGWAWVPQAFSSTATLPFTLGSLSQTSGDLAFRVEVRAEMTSFVFGASGALSVKGQAYRAGVWTDLTGAMYRNNYLPTYTWFVDSATITGATASEVANGDFRLLMTTSSNGVGYTLVLDYVRVTPLFLPTADAAVAGGGWTDAANAYMVNDTAYATAALTTAGETVTSDFDTFNPASSATTSGSAPTVPAWIPWGASINSVTITGRAASSTNACAGSYSIQAYSGSTALGTAATLNLTTTTFTNFARTLTNPAANLTRYDLMNGQFKVRASVTNTNACAVTAQLDSIQLTVDFTVNSAPTASSLTPNDSPTWDSETDYAIGFTTGDANWLTGATVEVCFRRTSVTDCSAVDGTTAAAWTISAATSGFPDARTYSVVADGSNGSFTLSDLSPASGSAIWNSSSIAWTANVNFPNSVASGTWVFDVNVTDPGGLTGSATSADITFNTNTAPTVSDVANADSGGSGGCAQWTPGATCKISFKTTDPDGLGTGGAQIELCLRGNANACYGNSDSYSRAQWTITPNGASASTVTADGTIGTWTADVTTVANAWTSTSAVTWEVTIRIGDIARAAADWGFEVRVTDAAAAEGTGSLAGAVTVPSSFMVVSMPAVDFGSVDPDAWSGNELRAVTFKCNALCHLQISSAATFSGLNGSIALAQATGGTGEFAIQCDGAGSPDASGYLTTTPTAITNVGAVAAFTDDSAQSQDVTCRLYNGYTRAQSYTGTVTLTLA